MVQGLVLGFELHDRTKRFRMVKTRFGILIISVSSKKVKMASIGHVFTSAHQVIDARLEIGFRGLAYQNVLSVLNRAKVSPEAQ